MSAGACEPVRITGPLPCAMGGCVNGFSRESVRASTFAGGLFHSDLHGILGRESLRLPLDAPQTGILLVCKATG